MTVEFPETTVSLGRHVTEPKRILQTWGVTAEGETSKRGGQVINPEQAPWPALEEGRGRQVWTQRAAVESRVWLRSCRCVLALGSPVSDPATSSEHKKCPFAFVNVALGDCGGRERSRETEREQAVLKI